MFALWLAAAIAAPPADMLTRVQDAMRVYNRSHALVEREVGHAQAVDIVTRLLADDTALQQPSPRAYANDYDDALDAQSALDVQTIDDLASGKRRPMDSRTKGLYETFVVSTVDHVWIPVTVYVPAALRANAPLAIMLHGSGESETNFLGAPYFRRLAERTGTILVAPYGRGIANFRGVAKSDVYDTLHAAQAAFSVDPKRTYLVGYSMGGFSVFELGPAYRWSAIMDISGALADSAIDGVHFAWRTTPVYVITGKDDNVVPASYPERSAQVLAALGIPTSFYEEPAGEHWVRTLFPSLSKAWADMHAGIVRSGSVKT